MSRSLTSKSSGDALKKEAKRWLKALRAGDATAQARYRQHLSGGSATPTLREVQHAIAREYGLPTWAALKAALEDIATASLGDADRAAELLELACLHYGVAPGSRSYSGHSEGVERRRRAARMLERHPNVGRHSIHTAVVSGDVDEVRRRLALDAHCAREKGGREGWEPLLFLCYGRLPTLAAGENAVTIATLLLDHGADPNATWAYEWDDAPMPFSAVCGAIGDGENGPTICPPHPRADELVNLLLNRGASPNQGQALYNTMLRGDDTHWLRVLIGHGLGPGHTIPWGKPGTRTMFEYLLEHAVTTNQLARAQLLLEHGASPVPTEGRSFYERALISGNVEMANLLVRHGAVPTSLDGPDGFRAACAQLDAATAKQMLVGSPELLQDAHALLAGPVASSDAVDVAQLLLDLGVSPDAEVDGPQGRYRALHQAACANSLRVAELLIKRGADVDARDDANRATPLGWALHVHMGAAIDLLSRHTQDTFTLVAGGCVDRLADHLKANPAAANEVAEERLGLGRISAEPGETPLFVLPDDEDLAIEVASLLIRAGADQNRRNHAGETAAEKAERRGLEELADWLAVAR